MKGKKKKLRFTRVYAGPEKLPRDVMNGVYRGPAPEPAAPEPADNDPSALPYPLSHAESDGRTREDPAMFLDVYAGPPMPEEQIRDDKGAPAEATAEPADDPDGLTPEEKATVARIEKEARETPMMCVYAGPEYFERQSKPLPPPPTPMMMVYAGPDYFANRRQKSATEYSIDASNLGLGTPVMTPPTPGETLRAPRPGDTDPQPAVPRRPKFCPECGAPYGDAEVCPVCGRPRPEKL